MVAREPITCILVSVLALHLGGLVLLTRVFPWKGHLAVWFGVPVFVWVRLGLQVGTGTALAIYRRKA